MLFYLRQRTCITKGNPKFAMCLEHKVKAWTHSAKSLWWTTHDKCSQKTTTNKQFLCCESKLGCTANVCPRLDVTHSKIMTKKIKNYWGQCDAPSFEPELLTLMSRSTTLTLVKRRSTWAITSKTSPTNPNDPFWSTLVNPWSNPSKNPLEHLWTHQCRPELLPRSPNFT
jgi:hypothetical protein